MPHDDKRQRILAAATAVFAERDFHRVQVSEVATRAGVGKGTVYLYFPTKDDLHRDALQASLERLAADVDAAAQAGRPMDETLEAIVLCILRFFWRRQHLLTLVQRHEQRRNRRAGARGHRVLVAVQQVLARHRVGGSNGTLHLSAAFLLGLARAAILEHGGDDRPEEAARRIVDLYLHGIWGRPRTVRGSPGGGMKRAGRLGLAALALALAACGRHSEAEGLAAASAGAEAAQITVTVAPVAVRAVERTVSVVGTLQANEQAELASESEGQVMVVHADLGDRVTHGQVLLEVRSDVIEAQLDEAEASLEKAEADEARATPLRAQGIIAEQEYEKVRTESRVARARRDRLRIERGHASIRAPFDGSVSARLTNLGDYVRPGSVVFRLVQDDPLKFRGEVPEREVPSLHPGQDVRITVDPYPGESFSGRVTRVGAASDPAARSLTFEAGVPNVDRRLRPGFFGHGEVIVGRDERAVAVPRGAVATFAGITKVFVVEQGVAHEHAVTLGVDLADGWVEVTQGVARGMQVVTSGLSRLADGAPVVVRADASPGA